MKLSKACLLLFAAIILAANISLAQDKSEIINKAVSKLQQKVLLNEDQAAQISSIITSNYDNIVSGKSDEAKIKIDALLNEKQKDKFNIISKDWFVQIRTGSAR